MVKRWWWWCDTLWGVVVVAHIKWQMAKLYMSTDTHSLPEYHEEEVNGNIRMTSFCSCKSPESFFLIKATVWWWWNFTLFDQTHLKPHRLVCKVRWWQWRWLMDNKHYPDWKDFEAKVLSKDKRDQSHVMHAKSFSLLQLTHEREVCLQVYNY